MSVGEQFVDALKNMAKYCGDEFDNHISKMTYQEFTTCMCMWIDAWCTINDLDPMSLGTEIVTTVQRVRGKEGNMNLKKGENLFNIKED